MNYSRFASTQRLFRFTILICFFILSISCSDQNQNRKLDELRIGILPDEGREKLLQRYTLLFEYLSAQLGIPYKLVIPKDYQDLLDDFASGQIDLAYFGGFTFLKAHHQFGAVPLVMRDTDLRFTSYFLVRNNEPLQSIRDFKGKAFSFGSRLSTSGHLMPRYFLGTKGIIPEQFFSSVEYSGKHDITAYRVRDGKVDLGAANSKVIDGMFADGRIDKDSIRVIWETPPFADYVWALQPDVDKTIRMKITNAFLALSPDIPEQASILEKVDSGGFVPAAVSDFNELDKVMQETITD